MLSVTATLPSFLRYIVEFVEAPGFRLPQLTDESTVEQLLFWYTPSCTVVGGDEGGDGEGDGEGVDTMMLPVLGTVWVTTSPPMALTIMLMIAIMRTVPMVAFCMAIFFH